MRSNGASHSVFERWVAFAISTLLLLSQPSAALSPEEAATAGLRHLQVQATADPPRSLLRADAPSTGATASTTHRALIRVDGGSVNLASEVSTNEAGSNIREAVDSLEHEVTREFTVDADRIAAAMPSNRLIGRLNRPARVSLTVVLCSLGLAIYLLHGGWVKALTTPRSDMKEPASPTLRGTGQRSLVIANLVARVVLLHPFVEYAMHAGLHVVRARGHLRHHTEVSRGLQDEHEFELWPYVFAVLAYPCTWTRAVTLGMLQYAWFHQCCHDLPWLMPDAATAHLLHHRAWHQNYGISLPASLHWPDYLFGTLYSGHR